MKKQPLKKQTMEEQTMKEQPLKKLLLTAREAARALAISPRKLWGMKTSGEIPHVRVGRSVRYPLDELQRWIDSQTKGGESR